MIAFFFLLTEFTISKIENPFLHLFSFQNFNLSINFHNTILSNSCGLTISQSTFQRKLEIHKLEAKFGFSPFLFFNPISTLILSLSSSKFHHFLAPVIKSVSEDSQSTLEIQGKTYTNNNIGEMTTISNNFGTNPKIQITSCIFQNIDSLDTPNGSAINLVIPSGKSGLINIAYSQFINCNSRRIIDFYTNGGAIYIKSSTGVNLPLSFQYLVFDRCTAFLGSSYYIESEDKQIQINFIGINVTNNLVKPTFGGLGTGLSYLQNCYLNQFAYTIYTNIQGTHFQYYPIKLVNCDGKLNNIQFTDIHPSSAMSAMISYEGTNKINHHIIFENIGCYNIGDSGYALYLDQKEPTAILTCEVINVWGRGEYYTKNQPITYIGTVQEPQTQGMEIQPTGIFTESKEFSNSFEFSNSIVFSNSAEFSNSVEFSNSHAFTSSAAFTKSFIFSKSEAYTESMRFTYSEISEFSNSSEFSEIQFSSGSSDSSDDVSTSGHTPGDRSTSNSKDAGMIAGITIAVIIILVIIALIIAFLCLRKPMCCVKTAYQPSDDDESFRELVFFSNNK